MGRILFLVAVLTFLGACSHNRGGGGGGGGSPGMPPLKTGSGQRCPDISGRFSCDGTYNGETITSYSRNFEVQDTAEGQTLVLYGNTWKLDGQIHEDTIGGVKVRYSADCSATSLALRASGDNGEENYLKATVIGPKTLHEDGKGLVKGKDVTSSFNCTKK